jgi:HEAT repeat protein
LVNTWNKIMPKSIDETKKTALVLLDNLRHGKGDRAILISQLRGFDQNLIADILSNLLTDANPEGRAQAVEAFAILKLKKSIESILPFLSDPDSDVRWEVAYWLKEYGNLQAVDPLIKALREDVSPNVRSEAALALGASGDNRARDTLLWAQDHDFEKDFHNQTVSEAARIALLNLAGN